MKAKEYVEKYIFLFENCKSEEELRIQVSNLFNEFMQDFENVRKIRHITTNSMSIVSLFQEFNQKWKAICRLLPKQELKEDGFKQFWLSKLPELNKYLI